VNVFLLATSDGPLLIDAGLSGPAPLDAVHGFLAQAGFPVSSLRCVLLTHAHIDHIGLATPLRELSGAWLGMHRAEADDLARFPRQHEAMSEMARAILVAGGGPLNGQGAALWLDGQIDPEVRRALTVEPLVADRLLEDGEVLEFPDRRLRVIWAPGHSPGHLCFWDPERGHLFTGDLFLPDAQSLPWIGPTDHDALGQFLASVARVARLPAKLVLPGHGAPTSELDRLARARRVTIAVFLREVAASVRRRAPATAWQVALDVSHDPLLGRRPLGARAQAVGRVLYGLRSLQARGLVEPDGLAWRLT
jgi:glyoxylase-like metal-dependent hydrolase (beta-lactamase superfamily II)